MGEWRETWADLEPKTKAGYESILNKHLLPRFGNAPIANITPDAVQKLVNDLAKDHAPNTTRRVYTCLRAVLALAVRRRYLATNAADNAKLPKKAPRNQARLYLSAPDAQQVQSRGVRRRLLRSACRRAVGAAPSRRRPAARRATRAAGVKDINTTSEHLTASEKGLLFGPTKTHAARKLSLPSPITAMLREHLAGPIPGGAGADALIFTAPEGGPVRHGLFYRRVFKPALRGDRKKKRSRPRYQPSTTPCAGTTCATRAQRCPWRFSRTLAMVQARLGHEDIRTTINIYGHLLPSVEAALADGLTATFNGTSGPNVATLR